MMSPTLTFLSVSNAVPPFSFFVPVCILSVPLRKSRSSSTTLFFDLRQTGRHVQCREGLSCPDIKRCKGNHLLRFCRRRHQTEIGSQNSEHLREHVMSLCFHGGRSCCLPSLWRMESHPRKERAPHLPPLCVCAPRYRASGSARNTATGMATPMAPPRSNFLDRTG